MNAKEPTAPNPNPNPNPNPRRVEAGRQNRMKRKGLTEEGRQRLRQSALRHRPWEHASGPRTAQGKSQAAKNGKKRQCGPLSVREVRGGLEALRQLLQEARAVRRMAGSR
jgi:hypothetical protein